jgi:integrase/recombinase XerD
VLRAAMVSHGRDRQSVELTENTTRVPSPATFDLRMVAPFVLRSTSEETRRTYGRTVREFFAFAGTLPPADITPEIVLRWRDQLIGRKQRPATVAFKLAVIRSLFEHLRARGLVGLNPASSKLVASPATPEQAAGRALTSREVRNLLAGPDRSRAEGARDHALLLTLLRLGLRVNEGCQLKRSALQWSHGRWVVRVRVKGGVERTLPVPAEVKQAIEAYVALDAERRQVQGTAGPDEFIFQPHTNYRTLVFDKPLSTRSAWNIVARWADFGGLGKVSPHDLRRTAITKALEQGLSYRQVQMMSGHRDPKTVMRYDHGRKNLEQNAVNFLNYDDE